MIVSLLPGRFSHRFLSVATMEVLSSKVLLTYKFNPAPYSKQTV